MSKLAQISLLVSQAYTVLEERKQLALINLAPSSSDNNDLTNALKRVISGLADYEKQLLATIQGPEIRNSKQLIAKTQKDVAEFKEKVAEYNRLVENVELVLEKELSQPEFDIDSYRFAPQELPPIGPLVKTVRFKDNPVESSPELSPVPETQAPYTDEPQEVAHFSDELHPITLAELAARQRDKPIGQYKDEVSDTESLTDREFFIQQQQTVLAQNDQLDELAGSARRQRQIGEVINEELGSQDVLLRDLEAQVDHSHRRLQTAKRRLGKVNERMKEHGHCLTIAALTAILFVLVVLL